MYHISGQFVLTLSFCPLNSITIEAISAGTSAEYTTTGNSIPVLQTTIHDSSIEILIPQDTNMLVEDLKFRILAVGNYGFVSTTYTNDINLKLHNCKYQTFTLSNPDTYPITYVTSTIDDDSMSYSIMSQFVPHDEFCPLNYLDVVPVTAG